MSVRVEIPRIPEQALAVLVDAPPHASPKRLLGLAAQAAFEEGHEVVGRALVGADFSGLVLRDCAFKDCDMCEVVFAGATLDNVSFVGSTLHGADFSGAAMKAVDLSGVGADDVVFAGARIRGLKLGRVDLYRPDFTDATLSGVDASDAQFRWPILKGATFESSDLTGLNVADALKDCDGLTLMSSEVTKLFMERCDLPALVMDRVKGSEAEFKDVSTAGGRLVDSTLDRATFEEFSANDLTLERLAASGASFKATTFKDCEMREVALEHSMGVDVLFSGGVLEGVDMSSFSALRAAFIDVREMRRVSLKDADVDDLRIDGSKLVECDFRSLVTEGMSLFHCDVETTVFAGASLGHATIDSRFDDPSCLDDAKWIPDEPSTALAVG